MVSDFISSIRSHFNERLSNPILGAFGGSWLLINWKIIAILLFSKIKIEDKIQVIETNYTNWDSLFLYPSIFTIVYLLIFPWALLGVHKIQEKAVGERRIRKLASDTNYLDHKVEYTRAEIRLESIRLEQELERNFETKKNEMELERERASHDFQIERERREMEYQLEERKAEYEERRSSKNNELEHERKMREMELEDKRRQQEMELALRKADLESRLKK